jgi:hypothetical protein
VGRRSDGAVLVLGNLLGWALGCPAGNGLGAALSDGPPEGSTVGEMLVLGNMLGEMLGVLEGT